MSKGIHWEWRVFGTLSAEDRNRIKGRCTDLVREKTLTDAYLWHAGTRGNVKIRKNKLKFKHLLKSTEDGCQLWREDKSIKFKFPLKSKAIELLESDLNVTAPARLRSGCPHITALNDALPLFTPPLKIIAILKRRFLHTYRYRDISYHLEMTELLAPIRLFTVCLESDDLDRRAAEEHLNIFRSARDALALHGTLQVMGYVGLLEAIHQGTSTPHDGASEAHETGPKHSRAPNAAGQKGATMNEKSIYAVYEGQQVPLDDLLQNYEQLRQQEAKNFSDDFVRDAVNGARMADELKPYQAELLRLQNYLEETQKRIIILFEGRDAAGKGGTIRRVTRYMNEKHYRVVALPKPTREERSQWYYQRYITHFPRGGEVVLFDRSWYNRAMVERVFGFCTEKEYEDFMNGVVWFERDLAAQGTVLIKLYFSVDKEEQARRFEIRRTDPLRQWKLSEIDVQAQERWNEFTQVKYEMLKRTNTVHVPWTIVRSHDKHKARLNAMKVILNSVPYQRFNPDLDFVPDPDIVISGARELELMEAELLEKGEFTF
jgi:polyphosphate kinase 2